MIEIKLIDEFDCPVITCDACGKLVRAGHGLGMVAFDRAGAVRFLHKQTCDADRDLLWMELDTFLEHLALNTRDVDATSAAPRAAQQATSTRSETPKTNGRRKLSPRRRLAILQRDAFRCQLCGRGAEADGVALHVDHQQPISKGGLDTDENLWTLCADCNLGKGNQT